MTQPGESVRGGWYWRINDAQHIMTVGHGTATTREGAVEQIAALLRHSSYVGPARNGEGIELILQGPEQ